MKAFQVADLEGKWFKVLGYNPKYDTYPCQTNTFTKRADGGLTNDIVFSVPNPKGGPAWRNNFLEDTSNSTGAQVRAAAVPLARVSPSVREERERGAGGRCPRRSHLPASRRAAAGLRARRRARHR